MLMNKQSVKIYVDKVKVYIQKTSDGTKLVWKKLSPLGSKIKSGFGKVSTSIMVMLKKSWVVVKGAALKFGRLIKTAASKTGVFIKIVSVKLGGKFKTLLIPVGQVLKKYLGPVGKVIAKYLNPIGKKIAALCSKYILPVWRKLIQGIGKGVSLATRALRPLKLKWVQFWYSERVKRNKKYIYSAIAVLFVAIMAFSGWRVYKQMNDTKINQFMVINNKAEQYYFNGEYARAIEEYKALAAKDKNHPKYDAAIAEIYSVQGDIDNSRNYMQIVKDKLAQQKYKEEEDILNSIVVTELLNKDYAVALTDGEAALKKFPKNKRLFKTMFTVYMANNSMQKATDLVMDYPVDNTSAYDTAENARMLMLVNSWNEGFDELKRAWDLDKDEVKVYDVLAQISVYNKDMLLENLDKLSKKNPNEIAYKLWMTKIYSLSDVTAEQAQQLLDSILAQNPKNIGDITIKLMQASIDQNKNQAAQAETIFNELIAKHGSDYRVMHAAGWFYLGQNDLKKAMEYCKKSISLNKGYPDNYGFLIPEILRAQGETIKGEPYFHNALKAEPYNYNIMLNLANYYWYTAKNSNKALEYFKFAEIVKPNDTEIKYNMALIYLTNNQIPEAINLLTTCIKMDEMVPKYHRTLGTIYMTQGNTKEGIKEVRFAYSADESDILTLNNAGCYYITVEQDLERGLINLQAAKKGITAATDKYTTDTINENYDKAKKLYDAYKNGRGNETLKIPEFVLFY